MAPELTAEEAAAQRAEIEARYEKNQKEQFLIQYKKCVGLLSFVCAATGVTQLKFRKWLREDKDFEQEIRELNEGVIDNVEAKLMAKIQGGDLKAIIFYLRTRGKSRGYTTQIETEKNDFGGTQNGNLVTIDLDELKTELPPNSVAKMIEYLAPIEDAINKNIARFPNRDDDKGARGFGERSNPTRFARARLSADNQGTVVESAD